MIRKASARWNGTGKEGKGTLSTQSGVLKETKYSFVTRFGDEPGTNPEELIAAAHAGCFSMKLSFNLTGAGLPPEEITTEAALSFEDGVVKKIHLTVNARVPGATNEQFQAQALDAKENCPISKLLNTEISMTAALL